MCLHHSVQHRAIDINYIYEYLIIPLCLPNTAFNIIKPTPNNPFRYSFAIQLKLWFSNNYFHVFFRKQNPDLPFKLELYLSTKPIFF